MSTNARQLAAKSGPAYNLWLKRTTEARIRLAQADIALLEQHARQAQSGSTPHGE